MNIMQLKRLWQTLTFFDVIPVFSCLQKLLTPSKQVESPYLSNMNYVLVSDNSSYLAQETIKYLAANNLSSRIITYSSQPVSSSPQTEIINLSESQKHFSVQLLERVNIIICYPQANITKFINFVNQHLNPGEILLCYFEQENKNLINLWGTVDDVVMGGVSNSNLIVKQKSAIFTGLVSTDNNGGFVSVRTKNFNLPWDLSAYQGIRLRVRGDGQRYKFISRCEGKWDGISYCSSFDTIANVWITIDIPFTNLIPVFRAKTVRQSGQFDSSKVYSLQLMLSKFEYDGDYNPTFKAGAFSLEIESIKAYEKDNSPQLILMSDLKSWNNYKITSNLLKIYVEKPEDLDLIN